MLSCEVLGLTVGAVVVVDLLEASGTGAGVGLITGETQVATAAVVGTAPVLASCQTNGHKTFNVG